MAEFGAVEIATSDYHTAGEPFRIVTSVDVPGASVAARRAEVPEAVDRVRRLLCHEPRGHADMYGGFVVPPDDDGADFGVLFWHKDGYSTACGHGTIALGAWAVETGRVAAPTDGDIDVTIDVPSGRVVARVHMAAGAVDHVGFRNVPARVVQRGADAGDVTVDLAWGGALYAFLPAADVGLRVHPDALPDLIRVGRDVKRALGEALYGTVFWEAVGERHHRNVAIFADGEVDRSPTGSATSARTALLADELGDAPWRNESIVGTWFDARVIGHAPDGVLTEVVGTAFRTGEHRFVLDPRDPLGTGFVLR